jgi:cell division control protein 45
MDTNLKKILPEKLEAIAPEYGLVELSYPSFSRSFGFALSSLSAADAVEGFSALLEVAKGQRMEIEREGGKNGGEWFGGTRAWNVGGREAQGEDKENVDPTRGGEEGRVKETQDAKKEQSWQVANFWIAWDACEE